MESSLPVSERLSLWSLFKRGIFAAPEDYYARSFVLRQVGLLTFMVLCMAGGLYNALHTLHHDRSYFWWMEWRFRHELINCWAFACVSCLVLVGIFERARTRLARGDESAAVKKRLRACHYGQRAFTLLAAAAVGVMACLYVENTVHLASMPRQDKALAVLFFTAWDFIPFLLLGWAFKYYQMHFMRLARLLDVPKPKAKLNAVEQWWVALVQRHFERCCVIAVGLFVVVLLGLFIWPLTSVERLDTEEAPGGLRLTLVYVFASLLTQVLLVMFLRKKTLVEACADTRVSLPLKVGFYACLAFMFIFAVEALRHSVLHLLALIDMQVESASLLHYKGIPIFSFVIFFGLIFSFQVTFKYHFRAAREVG